MSKDWSQNSYDYGGHRVRLDAHHRSENSAQALDGIHWDVRLQDEKQWPGLDPDPNVQRFHTERMRAVADRIDELIAGLTSTNGSGTPQSIQQHGAPSFGPGTWAAATYLQNAAKQVAGAVEQYAEELVTSLREAATMIRTAADRYEQAEHANQQSGSNLQAGLGGVPTAS